MINLLMIYTYNWSPLKSPNAATRPSPRPKEPASRKAFPANRFVGKGHTASVRLIKVNKMTMSDGSITPVAILCWVEEGRSDKSVMLVGVVQTIHHT